MAHEILRLNDVDVVRRVEWPMVEDRAPVKRIGRPFMPTQHRGDCVCPLCKPRVLQ